MIVASAVTAMTVIQSCNAGKNEVGNETLADLEAGFAEPPREARPFVWWHWMNGNITKEGIRKDLLWMDRVGIGGFHHFDAGIGVAPVVENRMVYMHDDWKDAFRYAIELGDSLGMEMTVASTPGWSCMGGPWVPPADAMKKLVWREMRLEGGRSFAGRLPEPFNVAGIMQNIRHDGRYDADEDFYEDIAVIALRLDDKDRPLDALGAKVSSSGGVFSVEQLSNDDLADAVLLPEDRAAGYAWIDYEFPEPVSFRAVSVVDGRVRPWPYNIGPSFNVSLQKSDDGKDFTEVVKIPSSICMRMTVSFPETSARFFRLRVENTGGRGAMVSEFKLHQSGRINHSEEKACFSSPYDLHSFPTETDGYAVQEVLDLTDRVRDGILTWEVPEGNWKVLRIGYSLTGQKNGPAPEEATGLEVDKLDPGAWSRYFHRYLDMYKEATGGLMGSKGIQYILTDSYEAGNQNWTPTMAGEFRKRRGYDLVRWLPVLTGEIVESVEKSEAFLWDWNITIAELYAENYGRINDIVKEYGMKGRYSESHECGRVYVADGMDIKRTASVPMAACWVDAGSPTMAAADIRESASVAHLYGQNLVAAESMTAHGTSRNAYSYSPRTLKSTADWEMAHGLNRFVIHDSAHQPLDEVFPGMGLGPYGQWFNRHETWADNARIWTDYLARSCYLLQRGKAVADILVYYGEDSNVCAQYGDGLPEFIPNGYNYDYAGPAVIRNEAGARKGRLVAGNMEYSLLYLGANVGRMSVDILEKLVSLASKGVPVCGHAPGGPAGMNDDKERWQSLFNKLVSFRNVRLEQPLDRVLAEFGVGPDIEYDSAEEIRFVHRHLPAAEIYWVNRPADDFKTVEVSFRQERGVPAVWNPETGKIEKVSYRKTDGRVLVKLDLVPNDAVFVVFSGNSSDGSYEAGTISPATVSTLEGPWNVRFQEGRNAPESAVFRKLESYTESSDTGIRYFSGKAVYTKSFELDAIPDKSAVLIDLGEVREIAVVKVNGVECGTIWKRPYRVDVTEAVRQGGNDLEVTVINPWINRLIGDSQPSCKDPVTYTSYKFFDSSSELHPAGLLGPVVVSVETTAESTQDPTAPGSL